MSKEIAAVDTTAWAVCSTDGTVEGVVIGDYADAVQLRDFLATEAGKHVNEFEIQTTFVWIVEPESYKVERISFD